MNCGQVCMYNTLRGCTVDEYGGKCPLFNTGDKEHKPMTNADRIRAMTDKELAELLDSFSACSRCLRYGNNCFPIGDTLDWLQQPAGGADHV